MDDSFLEDQLARIRRLTQSLAEMHTRVAENAALLSRRRDALRGGMIPGGPAGELRHDETDLVDGRSMDQPKPPDASLARERVRRVGRSGPRRRR